MRIFTVDAGTCPYFGDGRARTIEMCDPEGVDEAVYERILPMGFRRSGRSFYRQACGSCQLCIPIRLITTSYKPSKSQRRVAARNRDISLTQAPLSLEESRITLYDRYTSIQHGDAESLSLKIQSYVSFLLDGAFESSIVTDYRIEEAGSSTMVANGYLDVLPNGLSSVYFAWEPGYAKRSLGVLSVSLEVELARNAGRDYYYLGFWVPGSRKMDYKADHGPAEIAVDGGWRPLTEGLKESYRSQNHG